jgi:uncharacterized membrane protein
MIARRTKTGLAVVALCALTVPNSGQAFQRNVKFCNKSNATYAVAVAFDRNGDDDTRSQGWNIVNSCKCQQLFSEDVKTSDFFFYVRREGTPLNASVSGGSAPLCIKGDKFNFMRANKARKNCEGAGGIWVNFAKGDATAENHTLNFGKGAKCIDDN